MDAVNYTRGLDGRFGPTPFRPGWFAAVASASAPLPAPVGAGATAAAAAYNPFSPRARAQPPPPPAPLGASAAPCTLRPPPLALAGSPSQASPRGAPPAARAPFSPGRTLLDQTADAGGLPSWCSLTNHLKTRPSPTH